MTIEFIGQIIIALLASIYLVLCGLVWIALGVRAHLGALNEKPTGRHGPVK